MRQLAILFCLLLFSVSSAFVLTNVTCSAGNYANISLNGNNALYTFQTQLKNTTAPCAYDTMQTCVEETRYATNCDGLNSCSCTTVPQTCQTLTTNWYDTNYPKCRNIINTNYNFKEINEPLQVNVGDNKAKIVNAECNSAGAEAPYTANGNDILFYQTSENTYSVYYSGTQTNSQSSYLRQNPWSKDGNIPYYALYTGWDNGYIQELRPKHDSDYWRIIAFRAGGTKSESNILNERWSETAPYTEYSYESGIPGGTKHVIRLYRNMPVASHYFSYSGANSDVAFTVYSPFNNGAYETYRGYYIVGHILHSSTSIDHTKPAMLLLPRFYNNSASAQAGVGSSNGMIYVNWYNKTDSLAMELDAYYFYGQPADNTGLNAFIDYFERTPTLGEENLLENSYYSLSYDCSTLNCAGSVTTCSETSTPSAYNYSYNLKAETISGTETLQDTLCSSCNYGVFQDSRDYIFMNDTTLFLRVKDYSNNLALYTSKEVKKSEDIPYPFLPAPGTGDAAASEGSDWVPIINTTILAASVAIAYERRNYLQAFVSSAANTLTTITKKETIFQRLQREANTFATTVGAVKTEIKYLGGDDYEIFYTLRDGTILSSKNWSLVDLGLSYVTLYNGSYYVLKDGQLIELIDKRYVSATHTELFGYSKWQQDLIIFTQQHNDKVLLDLSNKNYLSVNGALISMPELDRLRSEYFRKVEEQKTAVQNVALAPTFIEKEAIEKSALGTYTYVPYDPILFTKLSNERKDNFNLGRVITGDVQTNEELIADLILSLSQVGILTDFRDFGRSLLGKEDKWVGAVSLLAILPGNIVGDFSKSFLKTSKNSRWFNILKTSAKRTQILTNIVSRLLKEFAGEISDIKKLKEFPDIFAQINRTARKRMDNLADLYEKVRHLHGADEFIESISKLGSTVEIDNLLVLTQKNLDTMNDVVKQAVVAEERVNLIAKKMSKDVNLNNLKFVNMPNAEFYARYGNNGVYSEIQVNLPHVLSAPNKSRLGLMFEEYAHQITNIYDGQIRDSLGSLASSETVVNQAHDLLAIKLFQKYDPDYQKLFTDSYTEYLEKDFKVIDLIKRGELSNSELQELPFMLREGSKYYKYELPMLSQWLVLKGKEGMKVVDNFMEKLPNNEIKESIVFKINEAKKLAENYENVMVMKLDKITT